MSAGAESSAATLHVLSAPLLPSLFLTHTWSAVWDDDSHTNY